MLMAAAEISALAALAGSAIGGITPIISNHVVQRSLIQRDLLSLELGERQGLYAEFLRFAATVYVQATTTSLEKMDDLIILYALVGRIRLVGSEPVIQAAENFANLVTKRFGEKNLTLEDLREATLQPHVDPLYEFSSRCREEIHHLFRHGLRSFPQRKLHRISARKFTVLRKCFKKCELGLLEP
jgi:hypothetical protein